jgi:hypothetical protein
MHAGRVAERIDGKIGEVPADIKQRLRSVESQPEN